MNFIVDNWYLILLVLVSGAMLLVPMIKEGGGAGLSAAMAVQLINREKAEVVDVWGAAEKRLVKHCGIAADCPISRTMA